MSNRDRHDPAASYRQEATELLERLEGTLLRMEQGDRESETLNEAFRALHTIKGSGAMFDFHDVVDFAHHFETAFDKARTGDISITEALVECSLRAADHLAQLVEGTADIAAGAPILKDLASLMDGVDEGSAVTDSTETAPLDAPPAGRTARYVITFYPDANAFRFGTNPLLLFEELRELGELRIAALADRIPALDGLDASACHLGWELHLETEAGREAVEEVFVFVTDDSELKIELQTVEDSSPDAADGDNAAAASPVAPQQQEEEQEPAHGTASTTGAPGNRNPSGESVRVAAERLDRLMDQVGELVIAQSRLADLAHRYRDPAIRSVSEDIERLVTDLRDDTLEIRMVPIGVLFSKFRRITRNLSRELGKSVTFEIRGEETEVDKTFIEQLNEPLVHLIRNSMDHGLEDEQTRLEAGKAPSGRLRLSAHQEGGEVLITVADDGRGIDLEKVRTRAVERGLLSPEQEIPEDSLRKIIFEPGFSTASEVSSISGRGVGMDAVRRTIEDLLGSISVDSEKGRGTRITLRLPLTLAIIEGFHVRVGDGAFVLPLDVVEECVYVSADEMGSSDGRSIISIRGQYVPFARMHDLFEMDYEEQDERPVVVIRVGGERLGLVVDGITGQRQTVIKPLTSLHRNARGLAGATILGDGSVALIVDVLSLVGMARNQSRDRRRFRRGAA